MTNFPEILPQLESGPSAILQLGYSKMAWLEPPRYSPPAKALQPASLLLIPTGDTTRKAFSWPLLVDPEMFQLEITIFPSRPANNAAAAAISRQNEASNFWRSFPLVLLMILIKIQQNKKKTILVLIFTQISAFFYFTYMIYHPHWTPVFTIFYLQTAHCPYHILQILYPIWHSAKNLTIWYSNNLTIWNPAKNLTISNSLKNMTI